MRTNTLSILLPVPVMALATSSASADPIRHSNGSRFFNNSHGFNGSGYNHYRGYNSNNHFNTRYDQNRHFRRNDFFGTRYNYRPYRNDGWFVSLNYGAGYNAWCGNGDDAVSGKNRVLRGPALRRAGLNRAKLHIPLSRAYASASPHQCFFLRAFA